MIEALTENPRITIYVAIGFIVWLIMYFTFLRKEFKKEDASEGLIGCFLAVVVLIWPLAAIGGIVFFIMFIREERQFAKDEEKRKEKNKKKAAAKRKSDNAKKKKIKENQTKRQNALNEIKNNFEENNKALTKKFFKDTADLGADLTFIAKKDIADIKTAIELIRFARLNVFTFFAESDAKKSNQLAKKLASSLKKLQ